ALVVGIGVEANSGGGRVTIITYGGVAMEEAIMVETGTGSTRAQAHLYYLTESSLPATGTHQLRVTLNNVGGAVYQVLQLQNVADAPPEDVASSTNNNGSGNSITTQITAATTNAWAVDLVVNGDTNGFTASGTNHTERADTSGNSQRTAIGTMPLPTLS